MRVFEWQNEKGETAFTPSNETPPDREGTWKRVYSFGIGSVPGAGGSPARIAKSAIIPENS